LKTARQWIFTANPKKVEVTLHKIPSGTIAAVTLGADVEESIRIHIAMWLGENRFNAEHYTPQAHTDFCLECIPGLSEASQRGRIRVGVRHQTDSASKSVQSVRQILPPKQYV
jgi:hypothetical protein